MVDNLEGLVLRCIVTGNPVGTDTIMEMADPCRCQGCRAADALTSLSARVAEAEGERDEALKDAEKWNDKYCDEAFYEVGGAPQLWSKRALAAEADKARLVEALRQFVAACDTAPPTSLMTELGTACAVARAALSASPTDARGEIQSATPNVTTIAAMAELESMTAEEMREACAKVAESNERQIEWPRVEGAQQRCPTANIQTVIATAIRAIPLKNGEL